MHFTTPNTLTKKIKKYLIKKNQEKILTSKCT